MATSLCEFDINNWYIIRHLYIMIIGIQSFKGSQGSISVKFLFAYIIVHVFTIISLPKLLVSDNCNRSKNHFYDACHVTKCPSVTEN